MSFDVFLPHSCIACHSLGIHTSCNFAGTVDKHFDNSDLDTVSTKQIHRKLLEMNVEFLGGFTYVVVHFCI